MKMTCRKWISIAATITVTVAFAGAEERDLREEVGRWRDQVVTSIDLWQPLINGVYSALAFPWDDGSDQAERRWRGIRSEVFSALEKNPETPFSVDIRLSIAMMDAKVMREKREAIQLLEAIRLSSPRTPTVHGAFGVWLDLASECYRRKGREIIVVPRDEMVGRVLGNQDQQARFACLRHLQQHPVPSADVALLQLAEIWAQTGDVNEAIGALETLVNNLDQVVKVAALDKERGKQPDGYYVASIKRPAIRATALLMKMYSKRGEKNKAMALGRSMAANISTDGYYWREVNEPLADAYLAENDDKNAESQYRIAVAGCLDQAKRDAERARANKRQLSREAWVKTAIDLKRRVQKAGGKITVDAKDIEEMFGLSTPEQKETPLEMNRIRRRMEDIHKRQGELSSAAGRQVAVQQIAEAVRRTQVGDVNEQKPTPQEKASVAIGLAHLASEEPDIEARRIMLGKMNEIGAVESAGKSDRTVAQTDRQKVDRLIKQMSGETGIEGAVPDPQSELSDMSVPALLYAAERIEQGALSLQTRLAITKTLANSENPALFKFFADTVQRGEDEKLTRFAVRGLERILENTQGGDQER